MPGNNIGAHLTQDTIPVKGQPKTTVPAGNRTDSSRLRNPARPVGKPGADTTVRPDSGVTAVRRDTFSLRMSKDSIDAPVKYKAEDSAVIVVPDKKIILYGKTHTTYKDVVLDAPKVEIESQTNQLTATADRDSLGETLTRARMQDGDQKFESDTIRYNFKSQKGLLTNTFTQQNELFLQMGKAKKVNANTVFVRGGRFTTCDLDDPHFAFRANKLKIINNKVAVSGPMHPEFEGVPVPVYLPFGYYPLYKGRHSGLLPPQFLATENQGIGLQGLGYYKVINEYIDATVRGDIYSYGGWRGDLNTSYRKRYRFNGAVNFSIQSTKINFKGDPDYSSAKTFNIMWQHSVDQRAKPGVTFSASVNAGSTKYNRYVTSSLNRNVQNQLYSTIQYSKNWLNKPFSMTLAANHNQNSETGLINVTLPNAAFTVNTQYPFQRREQIGAQRWYEKLGIGYAGSFQNTIAFYENNLSLQRILDTLRWGATHSLPVSLTLPPVGPLLISPGISYNQQWIQNRTILSWNQQKGRLDTLNQRGLYTAHSLSASLGITTNIFGTFQFRRSRIAAIRHTVRPNFSINYAPNLARRYYRSVQSNAAGDRLTYNLYSYGSNLYQGFSNVESGGIGFGVDNALEMKLRPKKDTGGVANFKKVRLIDGFGFNGGYDFLRDSFQLSNLNLYLRSTLFDKLNLNFSAILSPYAVDTAGRVLKDYAWKKGFGPGRITSGSVSLSTQFRSKPREGTQSSAQPSANARITDPNVLADQSRLLDYMRLNPTQFVDFNIPYDFGVDLALNFNREMQKNYKVKTTITSNLSFRSSFSLTPKWNFTTNGYVDVNTMKLTALSMSINRDMHCWQLAISLTPIGPQRYFAISLSPKSGILQNLRINRTRVFTDF